MRRFLRRLLTCFLYPQGWSKGAQRVLSGGGSPSAPVEMFSLAAASPGCCPAAPRARRDSSPWMRTATGSRHAPVPGDGPIVPAAAIATTTYSPHLRDGPKVAWDAYTASLLSVPARMVPCREGSACAPVLLLAPAEMVPTTRPYSWRSASTPRACGDGPVVSGNYGLPPVCSPFGRRAQASGVAVAVLALFPVHAGMVPTRRPTPRMPTPASCACGDGPVRIVLISAKPSCSPHPRG